MTSFVVIEFFNKMAPKIDRLAERWKDEGQYEDFEDYIVAVKSGIPSDFTFVKMTKKPFGLEFKSPDGERYQIRMKGNQVILQQFC